MDGVGEVADVDGPDRHTDNRDNLGELLTELVQLLAQGRLHVLRARDRGVDLSCKGRKFK